MTNFKSDLMKELDDRGLLHQCTAPERLDEIVSQGNTLTVYAGYDCTADSLHIGNLLSLRVLRIFRKYGHNVLPLIGTGTTKIGDPSGKDQARPLLDAKRIWENAQGIQTSIKSALGDEISFKFNEDWIGGITMVDYLRDIGSLMSINRMLGLDSVRSRINKEDGSMSFLEFNYSLIQALDFLHLYENDGVCVQIGGSDQWGNITMGIELIKKKHGNNIDIFGLTIPLLTDANGNKMGKSVNGAVWLNEENLSHFDFWQFWRNVDDSMVDELIKKFTAVLSHEGDVNDKKIFLANSVTAMIRGEDASVKANEAAQAVFSGGVSDNMNSHVISDNRNIVDVLVETGLCSSKSDARRMMSQNGIKLNDEQVTDHEQDLIDANFVDGVAKLSRGKKKHIRLTLR